MDIVCAISKRNERSSINLSRWWQIVMNRLWPLIMLSSHKNQLSNFSSLFCYDHEIVQRGLKSRPRKVEFLSFISTLTLYGIFKHNRISW